jgi:phage tail-like protein
MDANGTRFHLLLGEQDWRRCTNEAGLPVFTKSGSPESGLEYNTQQQAVTLAARIYYFKAAAADRPPAVEDRRGSARDRFGNFFWVDAARESISALSAGTGNASRFWPPAPAPTAAAEAGEFESCGPARVAPAKTLSGLAITTEHYLVVGTANPGGLLVFDLFTATPPRELLWPPDVEFSPFDMSATKDGGVLILDRENRRVWRLNRRMQVVGVSFGQALESSDFVSVFGAPSDATARPLERPIQESSAMPLEAEDPIAIESISADRFLILDRTFTEDYSLVWLYDGRTRSGDPVSTETLESTLSGDGNNTRRVLAHDFAFAEEYRGLDGAAENRLAVVAAEGNQAFPFTVRVTGGQLSLEPVLQFLPMRLYGGKALVEGGGKFFYDLGERWVQLLAQSRPRHASEGVAITPPFDSRLPDCVWHRLLMDACIPAAASVKVQSRWANRSEDLAGMAWFDEPAPRLRPQGSELAFARSPQQGDAPDNERGTWELLVQRAQARFLQLKLTFTGDGISTPRVRALRAYFGRFSYMERYLPAVYREDRESAWFLDRFLANFEGFFTGLEDRIANVHALFDVRSAPLETLDWLASFYGAALDPAWDEPRRRLFLKHAMEFYAWRGTPRGVEIALSLALAPCADERIFAEGYRGDAFGIRVQEAFRSRIPVPSLTSPASLENARAAGRWTPPDGRAQLLKRYRDELGLPSTATYPLTAPGEAALAAAWSDFSSRVIGFVPSFTTADLAAWREFLQGRYQRIASYNAAWQSSFGSFGSVPFPSALPADGQPLADWYQFEGITLPMRRTAHRFSVLAPVRPGLDFARQQERAELAKRIVEAEKPAHTVFDIKFYWAMFRAGLARLGVDTVLGSGSRVPELMRPIVLDQSYVGESWLASARAPGSEGRITLDRESACGSQTWGES